MALDPPGVSDPFAPPPVAGSLPGVGTTHNKLIGWGKKAWKGLSGQTDFRAHGSAVDTTAGTSAIDQQAQIAANRAASGAHSMLASSRTGGPLAAREAQRQVALGGARATEQAALGQSQLEQAAALARAQHEMTAQQINAEIAKHNAKGLMGAVGSAVSGVAGMFSDERTKEPLGTGYQSALAAGEDDGRRVQWIASSPTAPQAPSERDIVARHAREQGVNLSARDWQGMGYAPPPGTPMPVAQPPGAGPMRTFASGWQNYAVPAGYVAPAFGSLTPKLTTGDRLSRGGEAFARFLDSDERAKKAAAQFREAFRNLNLSKSPEAEAFVQAARERLGEDPEQAIRFSLLRSGLEDFDREAGPRSAPRSSAREEFAAAFRGAGLGERSAVADSFTDTANARMDAPHYQPPPNPALLEEFRAAFRDAGMGQRSAAADEFNAAASARLAGEPPPPALVAGPTNFRRFDDLPPEPVVSPLRRELLASDAKAKALADENMTLRSALASMSGALQPEPRPVTMRKHAAWTGREMAKRALADDRIPYDVSSTEVTPSGARVTTRTQSMPLSEAEMQRLAARQAAAAATSGSGGGGPAPMAPAPVMPSDKESKLVIMLGGPKSGSGDGEHGGMLMRMLGGMHERHEPDGDDVPRMDFPRGVKPVAFEYKDEYLEQGVGTPGPHVGVLAQDVEKTPEGATVVKQDPATGLKMLDVGGLSALNTAKLSEIEDRLGDLETKPKPAAKPKKRAAKSAKGKG